MFLMYSFVCMCLLFFFFNDPATTEIYTLSLHDALPIWKGYYESFKYNERFSKYNLPLTEVVLDGDTLNRSDLIAQKWRSEEHTSELQSRPHLVCRLLLEKKKKKT